MRHLMVAAAALTVFSSSAGGQELAARLDSAIGAAVAQGFSGVVRVEKDGKTVLERGYGLANRESRIPFSPSTVVQIGSNTKDFTIVSLLQLQQRGKLSFSDSLSKYFPQAPADKRAITIGQIVEHEAGFPLGLGGDFEPVTRDQLVDGAMRTPLLFAPGARRNYSNTGYAVLAAIIEKIAGTSYDEYVRDNILRKLGLSETGFHLPGFKPERLAHGYTSTGSSNGTMLSRPHAPDGPFWNLRGNGGMLSTVGDMSRFYHILFDTDSLIPGGERSGRYNRKEPIALAGSDRVSSFIYERDPAAGLVVIVASNTPAWPAPRLAREVVSMVQPGDRRMVRDVETNSPQGNVPGNPPSPAIAAIVREFVDAVNLGDNDALRRVIADRFDTSAGAPTVDERLERLSSMHGNLGSIEIVGMIDVEGGPVRVRLRTAKEGAATMTLDIDRNAPHRIRRLGLLVGGD